MRKSNSSQRFSCVVVCTLVSLLASPLGVGVSWAQTSGRAGPTFSGQATVVRANVNALGQSVVLSDSGPVASSGGQQEASLVTVDLPGLLTASVAHAAVVAQGDTSRAEASVADVNLTVAGNTITADFLMARAEARCNNGAAKASGSSELARLTINGDSVVVTGAPNQTITLPVGMVVINEQDSPRTGDITVNALHVVVPGAADVVISSAHADITNCAARPPTCDSTKDFVTGGGWIIAPSGAKGTFGVAGGIKNGAFWGHLTYIDHGSGMRVKGTGVTMYQVTGTNTRHIEGTAEVNGQSGFTYQVDVADNGEPGSQDIFSIVLSNGYASGNQLLQGGNIQIHNPCLR